jgi:lysophospholipase L1-like esterase
MDICIFGDSITWGANDNEGGGWVTRLRNDLAERDISVYNCGISGDNTDDLLQRFGVEAKAREPEVIVFAIGINDSQYTGGRENTRVSKEKFVSNLQELTTQAKKFTNKILFVGLTHVDELKVMPIPWSDENKNYDNTNVDLYNSLVEQVCKEHGLPFLNILSLVAAEEMDDGLHPNAEGHRKMYKAIKGFIENEIS